MSIHTPLLVKDPIHLTAIDFETDPAVESAWSHNLMYMRMMYTDPAVPATAESVKKAYEAVENAQTERGNQFRFAIRLQEQPGQLSRLIGLAEIYSVVWSNGTARVRLGIGGPQDWKNGYGTKALQLLLHLAFREYNLRRLTAVVPEYNKAALALFQKAGFIIEIRKREALIRDGRRWDNFHLCLLQQEWESRNDEARSDSSAGEMQA